MPVHSDLLRRLTWRGIGPPRGGRVVAVAGDPSDPAVFYFGACAGGIWKTDDAGSYWRNVSDGFLGTAAIGALAVSASDPAVVWAGTGESCVRNDVSHGDGVYRSVDGGRTWSHLGLRETRHISRVRVHPSNPDVAWVAGLGDIFGPNHERGVFRTTDGGKSWEHVLFRSDRAGAADLWLDPANPRMLFAALWDAERKPWEMRSGGPDSALYRSVDGGETWAEITHAHGLPQVLLGRMGVCGSPARPGRVWALIEAADDKSGLYRSEDGGDVWERVSSDKAIAGRPWYYSHIVGDPQDPDTIYSMNLAFWKSSDGGRTFHAISTPHGDNHDLWIDPANPRRMIEGNDGGACVSFNGGDSFSTIYNQPTGQFYHVDVDRRFPYRVYGTQQDNSAISVPSRSRRGAIQWSDCYPVGFSESGHIAVDPKNDDVVYSGAVGSSGGGGGPLLRYDHASEQTRLVTIWPEHFFGEDMHDQKHRFQWTFPIAFSPHDPHELYACGECVFRSRDDGQSWEAISPDLTRADPDKLKASGGPINKDTSGAEIYCTVFAFAESPHEQGVLWAGTDDGRVHLSRDAGKGWQEVTPPELGEWATVAMIEPSPHDPATVYLAAHRYRFQDRAPGLWKTADYGGSWQRISGDLPADQFTRAIRADPVRPGLLYAGTESSVWVSLDDGASWRKLDGGLPVVPIYDLKLVGPELVAASHGRGFWILDDVTPLRELPDDLGVAPALLFTPPVTTRYPTPPGTRRPGPGKTYLMGPAMVVETAADGSKRNVLLDAGANPPDGLTVRYYLREPHSGRDLELSFLEPGGAEIRSFFGELDAAGGKGAGGEESEARESRGPREREQRDWEMLPGAAGLQAFTWDLRGRGFRGAPDAKGRITTHGGYTIPPGRVRVRLRVAEHVSETEVEIRKDPRSPATQRDLEEQYDLLLRIRDTQSGVAEALWRTRALRAQIRPWRVRRDVGPEIVERARHIERELDAIEALLTQTKSSHPTDVLKLPLGLDGKLGDLPNAVAGPDVAPTAQARAVFEKHAALAHETFARLEALVGGEIAGLNAELARSPAPVIDTSLPSAEPQLGSETATSEAAGSEPGTSAGAGEGDPPGA